MLSDRQRRILTAIVDDYIRYAEPVGSRSISKRKEVAFSPATIRNEMADLEELGLLEQPHTSAGRVPSNKGYRYYVDHLIQPYEIDERDIQKIKELFAEKVSRWEEVLNEAAAILSQLTNYTSIALGPEIFTTTLKHFDLVPINADSAVAIIVTNMGHVEHRNVSVPDGVDLGDVRRVVNLLNGKLTGLPLHQVSARLNSEVQKELGMYIDRCEKIVAMLESSLSSRIEPRVTLSGTKNMLSQPEFRDVTKLQTVLGILEESKKVMQLFPTQTEGIQVRIGNENAVEEINQCSLISVSFTLDGESLGTIGILGPTRMDYSKVISLLDYLSGDLATLLARWYK